MKQPRRILWPCLEPLAGSVALGLLALFAGSTDASAQCSLCRDAVAASSPQTREAMNYAIIGLAMAPYGVVALAAWTLSPSVRAGVRARLRRLPFLRPGNPS